MHGGTREHAAADLWVHTKSDNGCTGRRLSIGLCFENSVQIAAKKTCFKATG